MTFKPSVGLDGFKVISSFDIQEIQCSDLDNEIYQLAIVLHPPEVINEKFLIRLRDCVLKLSESHPLKKWMKWVGEPRELSAKQQKRERFISEILTSQFNLITDLKVKNEIISILYEIPEETVAEKLLKSYLYLMIGNVTRSDNILRDLASTPPRVNWARSGINASFYHRLGREFTPQIMAKLSRHPADRKNFELFNLYLQNFYNEPSLLDVARDIDTSDVESKLGLKFIEGLAPPIVKFLRLQRKKESDRINDLRNFKKFPLEEQAYWVWPFMDIDPLISKELVPGLSHLEEQDQLWFIYLMNNEKLFDLYSRREEKSFLPGRRPYLKEKLEEKDSFMLSLYKLIEFGDINPGLVQKTTERLVND
ncbi:MAG: hypothetical protein ACLGHN_12550 [Bacteriovoracia bacterium]